jgi:chromosome segregation ATPase
MKRRDRSRPAPERTPHPDPATEIQLQQIVSLRRAAARNEQLLDEYTAQVRELNATISKHPTWSGHSTRWKQITNLNAHIERLNAENPELHDRIAELSAKISDTDLAYLDPFPSGEGEDNK